MDERDGRRGLLAALVGLGIAAAAWLWTQPVDAEMWFSRLTESERLARH